MKQANRKTLKNPSFTPASRPALALALALGITFTQVACAEDNDTTASTPDAAASQSAADAQKAAKDTAAAPAEKPAIKYSAGMQIPVDGTSLEAFEASLADIKTKATAAEYQSLESAIQYLMVYDLSAKRDKTKLAANLNGQTGEEIVGRVKW